MKRVAIYARVSTSGQTVDNQLRELRQVANRNGWEIVAEHVDDGISGAKGKDKRPALARLFRAVVRREVDIVAAWSVDRLGRSLQHLVELLGELHSKGVDLYLHQQGIDTTTPAGRAMFQMAGVFAEFERSMIQERVRAGLARARDQGKVLGRPRLSGDTEAQIKQLRSDGMGINAIARSVGCGVSAVQRVLS